MPEKIQFVPPRRRAAHAALPRRKIAFPLRENGARKNKNDKAIFLLGSVLNERGGGASLVARAARHSPSNSPCRAALVFRRQNFHNTTSRQ